MQIPLVDLRAQHDELRPEIEAAIWDIVDRSCFIGGPYVEAFERDFAAYCGAHYSVGCASGTDALTLALMAADVGPSDEVITVPFTFIATVEAITLLSGHPVFVDVDPATYTLDPDRLAEFLEQHCRPDENGQTVNLRTGRRVAAVIPVHLYGFPADMVPILALAERFRLEVIEDACQAHGALYCCPAPDSTQLESFHQAHSNGEVSTWSKKAGTLGHAGCFSFYPGKNLGAMGEAGALVTDDPEIAELARILRDHGQRERYVHVSPDGWNGRLDAIQAAILSIKLRRLDGWNERRRQVAQWYNERLADLGIYLPVEREYGHHVYHLYIVRLQDREQVRTALAERGIATGLHYPIPLHLQEAYRHLGYHEGDFPVSEEAARSVLSLPMYPHLTEPQVDYICRCLQEVLDRS